VKIPHKKKDNMLIKDIPRRILSLRAYRVVATSIATNAEHLKKELLAQKEPFPPALDEALAALETENQTIASFLAEDISLQDLDRDTDHIIAAFRLIFFHWIEVLSSTDYKTLPTALNEKLTRLQAALFAFFPEGTAYLNATPKLQWTHLVALQQAMSKPENAKHLDALGLTEESQWISGWVDLYGSRIGITDAVVAAKLAKLEDHKESFQNTFDSLTVQVFAGFKDNKRPDHLKHRATLMAPYLEEVEKLRSYDRKARKAKADKEKPTTPDE
jgi:hypothetical protein